MLNRLASVLVDQNARRVTVKPDPRRSGIIAKQIHGSVSIWASSFYTNGKTNSVLWLSSPCVQGARYAADQCCGYIFICYDRCWLSAITVSRPVLEGGLRRYLLWERDSLAPKSVSTDHLFHGKNSLSDIDNTQTVNALSAECEFLGGVTGCFLGPGMRSLQKEARSVFRAVSSAGIQTKEQSLQRCALSLRYIADLGLRLVSLSRRR